MTHAAWEHGEQLTINNATKAQLQRMIKDRDARIAQLSAQIETERQEHEKMIEFYREVIRAKDASRRA